MRNDNEEENHDEINEVGDEETTRNDNEEINGTETINIGDAQENMEILAKIETK